MSGTYSFVDYNCSIKGPGLILNLSESAVAEEGIDWEMDQDDNVMTKGASGDVMHNLHAATAGRFTIRLLKTSPGNAILGQARNAQRVAGSAGWGLNTITGSHTALGDKFSGIQCAFKRFPGVGYKMTGGFLEWQFDVGQLNPVLGGGTLNNILGLL